MNAHDFITVKLASIARTRGAEVQITEDDGFIFAVFRANRPLGDNIYASAGTRGSNRWRFYGAEVTPRFSKRRQVGRTRRSAEILVDVYTR